MKGMIYDKDPWLEPYKIAIDARHRRILEAEKHLAGKLPLKVLFILTAFLMILQTAALYSE